MQRSGPALLALLVLAAPSVLLAQEPSAPAAPRAADEPTPVAATPAAILGLAADAALGMPLEPHVKTRSRLQAEIVDVAVAQGEFDLARSIVPRIENWRRGLAQAAIAARLAELGHVEEARAELARAEAIEATLTDEFVQGWRRDRVRGRIAAAYAHLGDVEKAAMIQARLAPAEAGRLAQLSARMAPREKMGVNVEAFLRITETGDLEQIKLALLALTEFYGQCAGETEADAERRAELEQAIRDHWTQIPGEPRIEILEALVAQDLAAGRRDHARALVDEIEALVRDNRWNAEQRIAFLARVGRMRHGAGQTEEALATLREAVAAYDEAREGIVSIWRGRSLRPLAEAFHAVGSPASAAELYERALVEAVVNPNSRPRLEDLVATCNSIVASGLDAPVSLRKALARTRAALGAPW